MKALLVLALCAAALPAQTLTFAVHDNTGATPDVPLPAAYQFASTQQGSSTSIMIRVTNSGLNPVEVVLVYVGNAAGASNATPNFTVTGLDQGHTLAPTASQYFTLNFTPSATGQLFGYLQVAYAVQQSGCILDSSSPATQCTGALDAVSTLEGTGLAPDLLFTYNNGAGSTVLLPNSPTRLDFGSVATSATSSITFTLANQTSSPIAAPAISIQSGVFSSSAFSLNTTTLPSSLAANASAPFTITFAPGQIGLTTATLLVGSNSYGIQGTGIVVTDIDALQIAYVDATGVRTLPQAATPISFGQLVPGAAGGTALNFTVTNPATSFNAVTISALSVSGAAFAVSGAPALPVTIQPNTSISFAVTFSAIASGSLSGKLTIGTRSFSLVGLAVVSPVPSLSLQLSEQTLTSAQQANLTVNAATPSAQTAIGELALQFTPSISNVTDDPAIVFLATSSRNLQVTLAAGSQTATYQGQTALSFQTGTTAGTITFTLTFPNTPPLVQSFTITPAQIHLSSAQALRQSPNLVLTLTGYDNTYSAGQLAFTFFDTQGKKINAEPMSVDATSDFHEYFFTNNVAGGSFALQASFPAKGDVTAVGSVAITLTNTAGQTQSTLTFQ